MIIGCSFGERVKEEEITDFERKYIQHQSDFAYKELGDQLDDDPELLDRYGSTESVLLGDNFVYGLAQSVRYCVLNRYLGNCTTSCKFNKTVGSFLESAINKSP